MSNKKKKRECNKISDTRKAMLGGPVYRMSDERKGCTKQRYRKNRRSRHSRTWTDKMKLNE